MIFYSVVIHLNVFLFGSIVSIQEINLKPIQVFSVQQSASTSLQTKNPKFNNIKFQTIYITSLPTRSVPTSNPNLLQSSNANQPNNSTASLQQFSAIYSAIITGAVVLFVGILTFLHNRASLAESKRKERRESITKKLNEFYGPLHSYIKIIYEFNLLLKTNKPSDFRTLTHLLNPRKIYKNGMQVDLSGSDKKIIDEIIDVEKKIEELVTSKGGLIDEPNQADLLAKAIAHFRVLRLAFNGEINGEVERFENFVYPRDLDEAVQNRITSLQTELIEISTSGWIEKLLRL